jgi:hypothetical protein
MEVYYSNDWATRNEPPTSAGDSTPPKLHQQPILLHPARFKVICSGRLGKTMLGSVACV